MAYSTITRGQAVAAVAERLQDPTYTHWTQAELTIYLEEAIRTWSAYTQPFRDQGTFQTTFGTAFYDLTIELPALRGQTVTDRQIINEIEYQLMEPPSGAGAWVGTTMFTLNDLTQAVQRRRDQFLLATGCYLTQSAIPVAVPIPIPKQQRVTLPATVLQVHRLAWIDSDLLVTPIARDDEWGWQKYRRSTTMDPGVIPITWSISATPPLEIQLVPGPWSAGNLSLTSTDAGAGLNPATPVILGIPDDWAWVIKWGALADLLGMAGLAYDPVRSAYCEARWQQGVEMAKKAQVTLAAAIVDTVYDQPDFLPILALADADKFARTWQQQTVEGNPAKLITAGQNLVALWKTPIDTTPPSLTEPTLTLDLVVNASFPATDIEYLPLSADQIDPILDYTQHLAVFKEGPSQLEQSQALLNRFLSWCGVTVIIQQAQTPARADLLTQTQQDQRRVVPEESAPVPTSL